MRAQFTRTMWQFTWGMWEANVEFWGERARRHIKAGEPAMAAVMARMSASYGLDLLEARMLPDSSSERLLSAESQIRPPERTE